MDFKSILGLMFLLLMSRIVLVQGSNHQLECVNDYMYTINCSLKRHLPSDLGPFWLRFTLSSIEKECPLSEIDDEHFFCFVKIASGFVDSDVYKISLCHEESCELLDNNFRPALTIKPQPPCCLTVTQNSSQHHFFWKSNYEEISDYTDLVMYMKYELRFHQTGYQHNGTRPHDVYIDDTTTTISLGNDNFEPGSEYVAKVRSSPNKAFYEGQWSEWSGEVHWTTGPALQKSRAVVETADFKMENVLIITVCVLVPLILFICFVPIKKWKQSVFIPTPEPYFQTLYRDCQGDFKSWVIMKEKTTADIPKTEKTLPIDSLFKSVDQADPCVTESTGYMNMRAMECPIFILECPKLDVPSLSDTAYMSPSSRGPAEEDSGCCLSSDQSLEKAWYCNDYCTLSGFQQSALGPAQCGSEPLIHRGTCVVARDDYIGDVEEIQSVCV